MKALQLWNTSVNTNITHTPKRKYCWIRQENAYFYSVHGEYLKHSHINHQMLFFGVDQNYVQDT